MTAGQNIYVYILTKQTKLKLPKHRRWSEKKWESLSMLVILIFYGKVFQNCLKLKQVIIRQPFNNSHGLFLILRAISYEWGKIYEFHYLFYFCFSFFLPSIQSIGRIYFYFKRKYNMIPLLWGYFVHSSILSSNYNL